MTHDERVLVLGMGRSGRAAAELLRRDGADLCLYDRDATGQTETQAPAPGTNSLLVSIDTPAGASWKTLGSSGGFLYKNPSASDDGATHVTLAAGQQR